MKGASTICRRRQGNWGGVFVCGMCPVKIYNVTEYGDGLSQVVREYLGEISASMGSNADVGAL